MREKTSGGKRIGGGTAFLGGLMIAALAFSAGVLGARSHKPAESPAIATVATSAASSEAMEVRAIGSSDQNLREGKVPGHSELDLQLD